MGSARVNSFAPRRLRDARETKGLSQSQLAELLGLRNTDVWRWENKIRRPSPDALRRLAEAVGVAPVDLTDAADEPTLADLRQIAGLTQANAGRALGLSTDQWALLEHGRGDIGQHAAATALLLHVQQEAVVAAHGRSARGQTAAA